MTSESGKGWEISDGLIKTSDKSMALSSVTSVKIGTAGWLVVIISLLCAWVGIATIFQTNFTNFELDIKNKEFLGVMNMIILWAILIFIGSARRIKIYSAKGNISLMRFSPNQKRELDRLRDLVDNELKNA